MKVRSLLLLLFAACELPLLAACALITYHAYSARRALNEEHMLNTARVLLTAVDERLAVARSSLQTLATSPAFATGDMAAIHEQAVALARLSEGADVIVADRDGMQLINSYRPFGTPPVRRANVAVVRTIFEHGDPVVSGVFKGAITRRYLISVDVPVRRNGVVAFDLSMTIPADSIQATLTRSPLPPDWYATVVDGMGHVVARTALPEQYVGSSVSHEIFDAIERQGEGVIERRNLEGTMAQVVFSRRGRFGWAVAVGVPKAVVIADTLAALSWVFIGVGAFSLIGLVGAVVVGRRVAAAIESLVAPALALGEGRPVTAGSRRIAEIGVVAQAMETASRLLSQHGRELRQSEARFRDFAESASDWLWETDAGGRLTYLSERFETITGVPRSYMLGSRHDVYTDPRYPDNDLASLTAAVSAREAYSNKRLVLPLPDGRVVWFRVGGRPRYATDGTFLGYRGAATDITAEMLTQERRQQAQKMAALGRLAGGIAHDSNNVLSAIIGFAQFLREDLPPGSEQHRFAERILHAADRARGLTRQILSFARSGIEARKPLPFGRVVGELLPLLRAALPSTTAIELAIHAEDAWILGNETELSQLVLNLCVNASDAFEGRQGTVRIRVEIPDAGTLAPDARGPATTTADPAGVPNPVCLVVEDDGIGMSDDVLRQVFEPFFTTKPSGRGTGLGLSVVHGIVTTMGGVITIASRPDVGTRVQVFLPRTDAIAAVETPVDAAVQGKGRVLVAEDDADVAAMTVTLLTRLGYQVERRADAAETLAAIEARPAHWDLVLSDFAMPNATGLDLIRAIKRLRPDLPCILITGFMEGIAEDVVLAAGADALLHKPLDQRAFSETVQRLIRRREAVAPDPAA